MEIILQELDNGGLKLKIEKCKFYQRQVKYLGYVIGNDGITMDEDRINMIKEFPPPRNLKHLGFLGMLNFYKKFIYNLSEKQEPLYTLLRVNAGNGSKERKIRLTS